MSEDEVRAYVRAAAGLAGLTLGDESFEAVTANTRVLQDIAAEFAGLELPESLDPAEVLGL